MPSIQHLLPLSGPRRGEPPQTRPGFALAAASLGFAIVQLDVSVVNVAVRSIGADLGAGIGGLQWVVDAYTVAFAALILTAGALGDRYGAPRVLLIGFGVFTLASAACGLAPSAGALIAFRVVQGAGAAALGACSLALISRTFPDPVRRARALGVWSVTGSVAMAAGPLAGGLLIAIAGWRGIFFINLPVGVVGAWLTTHSADQVDRRGGPLDLRGQVAAAVALALVAAATIEAGTDGLTVAVVIGYLLAAAAAVVFVAGERRSAHPMLPLGLFRERTFSAAVGVGSAQNVMYYGLIFVFSLFLQRAEGLSALVAGTAFVPLMILLMTGNAVSARLLKNHGAGPVIGGGGLIVAAASVALWLSVPGGAVARSLGLVIALTAGLAAVSFGMGLAMPAMTSAVLGAADGSQAGIASGTLTAFRQSGSVLGVAVFGAFADAGLAGGLRASFAAALILGLVIAALSRLIRS
ncbi:MAG TPA: MFS transporter [Trebonia sp.]|jgi:DHA2 family methylenomycin A resistance protein-like MFS transporter|nr:MFS transporter [Trebonia sp.]